MDKVVLITGGSGALGGALVEKFSCEGWKAAFTFNKGEDAAKSLRERTGASGFKAELTDPESVVSLAKDVLERFGHVDALVNNAGRTQVMPFALIEPEDWDDIMESNLKTMYLATREFSRGMISRKSGCIVNIGSLAGHRILEVPVHYAAAKAGVTGFTLSLARELARYNIRVNEVVPGLLSDGVGRLVPENEVEQYKAYCTSERTGKPSEVAELVFFLCGGRSGYINAQSIFIDGGI